MEREEPDELIPTKFSEPDEARWTRSASLGLGAFVFFGGLISFLGWLADIPRLTDWDGTGISIQPNTTVTAMACGAALILLHFGCKKPAAGLGVFVALVGFTALLQNTFRTDFGFNTILMFGREWGRGGLNIPGLMGFPGSMSWTLLGTAIVLFSIFSKLDFPKSFKSARLGAVTLAGIALVISSLSLIGYIYGAKALYTITAYTAIAFQTALFIFAASLGVTLGIRETGPMRLFSDPGPAGILTRRLVPPLIVLPILIGAIRLIGERAGFYDLPFGSAMRTVTEIGLLLTIVWWAGKAIDRQAKRVEETQNDLKRLADAMPQVVWMSDNTGAVEYYNERAADFAGVYLDFGKHEWHPGVHPDDIERTLESWEDAVRKGEIYTREHRIQMADGSFRWHLSRAIPSPGSNGSDQKWFGTATDIHDLKTAEYALRESEQRFARFMQNLPGLAWIKDREGRYIFANEAAQMAFGKTGAELYGKTDIEIFDPETAAGFIENDRLAFESPTGRQTVEGLKDEAGNLRYSLVSKFPIHVNGEPSLIGGMAIDITEQKIAQDNHEFLFRVADKIRVSRNAEELLAEISKELGTFLGLHRCLFNEIDIENDLEIVHRDYARSDESVAGQHKISDYSTVNSDAMAAGNTIVNKDSKNDPRTTDYFDKTYGPNKELSYVAVPMLREGKWVASLWCSDDRPRDWSSHEITLIENIAERAWAAVERLRSEVVFSRLAAIVQSSDDAIISKDLNGIITSWNRGAERVFGYTESEMIGNSITMLIPSDRLDEEPGILERIRRGESIDHYETVRRRKDGALLDISLTVSPIFDADGKVMGASKVARDITERKIAERLLRESEQRQVYLLKLSDALRSLSDRVEIQRTATRILAENLEADLALYAEFSDDGTTVQVAESHVRGVIPSIDGSVIVDAYGPAVIEKLRAGEAVAVEDVHRFEWLTEAERRTYADLQIISFAAVPIVKNGCWVSNLAVFHAVPHQWQSGEIAILRETAERTWSAVGRAKTEEALRLNEKRNGIQKEAFQSAINDEPLASSLNTLTRFVKQQLGDDVRSAFYLAYPDGKSLHAVYGAGDMPESYTLPLDGFAVGDDSFCSGYAIATGKATFTRDVFEDPNWQPYLHLATDHNIRSCSSYPILSREGRAVGSFAMYFTEAHDATPQEATVADAVTQTASIIISRHTEALERARAEQALLESHAQLRRNHDTFFNLVRNTPFGIYVVNSDFRLIQVSQGSEKVFSNVHPLLGRDFGEIIRTIWEEPFASEVIERFRQTLATGETYRAYDTTQKRADVTEVESYDWKIERITLPDDSFGVVCYFYDLTELREAQEQIRMISRMPEENPNPVLRVTPAGEILYANPAANPVIEHWERVYGESLPEDFRWCVSEAFETNSKQTLDIVYDDRFLSCNLSPVAEGGYVNVYADDVTERQRAEEALRVSEERYRALIELSPQFVFMSRPDGYITYVNQYVLEFSGKQYEEMLGTGWSECIHPDAREAEFRKWSAAVENGSDYESDIPFIYHDGSYRTVFARAQAVRDEEGRIAYWIGTALDVEDRKQAQEMLRASEAQLRLVTDAIPALVSYIDKEERYRFVNKQYSDWFGKPREAFLGKRMRDVLGARAHAIVKPHVAEALSGKEVSFDSWLSYKGAGQRYVHVSYVPDRLPDGTVNGLFALVSDLTELKRSEDLLRASQERMQLMTESFTDYAIMSTDNEGLIDSWNPGAEAIFGYSEEEIIGRAAEILFTPEDVVKGVPLKEMRDARRHGRASDERWHVRRDGSRFFASGVMVPLYIGRVLSGYAKIAADLTERKRNAEALQRAHDQMEIRVLERTRELAEANAALRAEITERQAAEEQKIALLKRLVTSQEDERRRIARDLHDQLGQRLTALRLKIASLRAVVGPDPELQARTNRLQEIGELLDSEVSFLAWELRPSAIEELGLTDAIGTFAREWSRHYGIPAEFHSMAMGHVQLDPEADTHLYRIAQEALNNIVKHANAKSVNILLEHTDGEIVLIVEDDGKGFDRQVSKRTKKSGGLGLTGMEERASLIGGAVEIESSPGSGTTIFARIPLKPENNN